MGDFDGVHKRRPEMAAVLFYVAAGVSHLTNLHRLTAAERELQDIAGVSDSWVEHFLAMMGMVG